jgi:Uncharacterized protein conserved in bacteria
MQNIKEIPFYDVTVTDGFWKQKQDMIRETTIYSVYKRFFESGRFDTFRCDWEEGKPNKPHHFWESDVAKWIESVAFLVEEKNEPELVKIVDETIDNIEKNQDEDGYYNSFFTVVKSKEQRFTDRSAHELYTAGHLMEAAVAYSHATGKDKFLKLMCRYADHIEKVFVQDEAAAFTTPGHEEIELALIKLYHATGEKRYLLLSSFFIDKRGTGSRGDVTNPYAQDHAPVREQTTPEGHAVRAMYLYCGMADVARETGDEALFLACERIFQNTIKKRMYVSGGIGSTPAGETFTVDYDLPNVTAYTETCAAIAFAMFCHRMQLLSTDSIYADTIERILYNGFLSGVSLDGKAFFYENPLEMHPVLTRRNPCPNLYRDRFPITKRVELFQCSCCPPNVTRFIPSIGQYIFTAKEDTLYLHQFMQSEAVIGNTKLSITTKYPADGTIHISVNGTDFTTIAVRIPSWCDHYSIRQNGKVMSGGNEKGYYNLTISGNEDIIVQFDLTPYFVEASPDVSDDASKCALFRGPVLYCLEQVDNAENINALRIKKSEVFVNDIETSFCLVPTIETKAVAKSAYEFENDLYIKSETVRYHETKAKFIPYYAYANRGESEMLVFFHTL